MALDKQQYAIIGGVAVGGFLLLRHFQNAQAGSSTATGSATTPDTAAADNAALAGQEQSDVAGLQNQEQSDVQTLLSGLGGQNAQEQGDVSTLQTQEQSDLAQTLANITAATQSAAAAAVQAVTPSVSTLTNQVAAVSAGQQALDRSNQTLGLLLQKGDVGWLAAPFGGSKPNAPAGYTSVGLGNGYWAFKPNAPSTVGGSFKQTGAVAGPPKKKK